MATPRVKRPFSGFASDPSQRQITSFFARDESETFPSSTAGAEHHVPPKAPLLPPSVQANLLSVGMRVRKSVPEGYKTGKDIDGEDYVADTRQSPAAAPSRTATAPPTRQPSGSTIYSSYPADTRYAPAASAACGVQELLPFCGLYKVGGLGVQSFGEGDSEAPLFAQSLFSGMGEDADGCGGGDDDELSEPPSLTSSQDTVLSTASAASTAASSIRPPSTRDDAFPKHSATSSTRKRVHNSEEAQAVNWSVHEDVIRPAGSSVNTWLSAAPSTAFYQRGRRVLAMPRRRQHSLQQQHQPPADEQPQGQFWPSLKPSGQQHGGGVHIADQENTSMIGGGGDADFDEAGFLDISILAEAGRHDTEMGGM